MLLKFLVSSSRMEFQVPANINININFPNINIPNYIMDIVNLPYLSHKIILKMEGK